MNDEADKERLPSSGWWAVGLSAAVAIGLASMAYSSFKDRLENLERRVDRIDERGSSGLQALSVRVDNLDKGHGAFEKILEHLINRLDEHAAHVCTAEDCRALKK